MKNGQIIVTTAKIAIENGILPEWYLMYPVGWNELASGEKFLVDQQGFADLARFTAKLGRDIVFDYEHQTLEGGQAPAAGWIKELKFDPETGIHARIEWTEKAKNYIIAGEYRYCSPVTYYNKTDLRIVGIHSVALTNSPKTMNILPLVAKLALSAQTKEDPMLKKLIAKLDLEETATEDQVMAAIDAAIAKPPETVEVVAKDVLSALDLDSGDVSSVVASIHALKQTPKGMVSKADFDALKAEIREKKAADAVSDAMAVGKITPDQKEWADDYARRDLAGFGVFIAKAPVVVPVGTLKDMQEKPGAIVDDSTMAVAKMFGNTKEDIEKYGG